MVVSRVSEGGVGLATHLVTRTKLFAIIPASANQSTLPNLTYLIILCELDENEWIEDWGWQALWYGIVPDQH